MKSRGLVKLDLSDPGWKRIDDAALRVSGKVKTVIADMQNVLDDRSVRLLCRNLGIYSSGFLFYDVLKQDTKFYRLPVMHDQRFQTYRTEYVWNNPAAKPLWKELVHWLFVQVRMKQYRLAKRAKTRTEDYFVHLPFSENNLNAVMDVRVGLRKELCMHYCSFGEILYSIVVWRLLSTANSLGGDNARVDSLDLQFTEASGNSHVCLWEGKDLVSAQTPEMDAKTASYVKELRELWGKKIGPQRTWRSEWSLLRLRKTGDSNSLERESLIRFATGIGVFDNVDKALRLSDVEVYVAIQKSIGLFFRVLKEPCPGTVKGALRKLERAARFPLLPFYVWLALDQSPKCYVVSSVWASQHYHVDVGGASCRHLGLALSAVAPLSRLDWTLPPEGERMSTHHLSHADPVVLANVFRLMARPLVEGHLYHMVARAYNESLRDYAFKVLEKSKKKTKEQTPS